MSKTIWKFSVTFDGINGLSPRSNGVFAASAEDVERLGEVSGLPVASGKRRGKEYRKLSVECEQGDPALQAIFDEIYRLYSFQPSSRRVIPEPDRESVFGVRREREYNPSDIEQSTLLMLHSDRVIADDAGRSEQEIAHEKYVVENYKTKKTVLLGALAPFSAIAIDESLKNKLETVRLSALRCEQVIGGTGLWKLSSSVILPTSSLPLVNGRGQPVSAANGWEKFEERWFDDGFSDPELVYLKSQIKALPEFDVAMTAERVGQHNAGAYRYCVVSQSFRAALDEFRIQGVRYTPVRIADEIA